MIKPKNYTEYRAQVAEEAGRMFIGNRRTGRTIREVLRAVVRVSINPDANVYLVGRTRRQAEHCMLPIFRNVMESLRIPHFGVVKCVAVSDFSDMGRRGLDIVCTDHFALGED